MAETAEQRRRRHLDWIEFNANTFTADAPRAYGQFGRGVYIVTATPGPPGLIVPEYFTRLEDLAGDPAGEEIARLVRDYDPATQFVVVIREPDDRSLHAYRAGLTYR